MSKVSDSYFQTETRLMQQRSELSLEEIVVVYRATNSVGEHEVIVTPTWTSLDPFFQLSQVMTLQCDHGRR